MHLTFVVTLALAGIGLGAGSDRLLWKRIDLDPAGGVRSVDSLTYDAVGKLLGETRKGPEGELIHSVQYHFDDSGRAHKAVKLSPNGETVEEARCIYAGKQLSGFNRTAGGNMVEGLNISRDKDRGNSAYLQKDDQAIRFVLDAQGRAKSASMVGRLDERLRAFAVFKFDAKRRHVATRFFGADSAPIGRDTLLLEKDGRLRELRRFDAEGNPVATVEREYGSRKEIINKVFRDQDGAVEAEQAWSYLGADSLARLNKSSSTWKGAAAAGPCDPEWFRNVDWGIEFATVHGFNQLYHPPVLAALSGREILDSVDREMEFSEMRRKAYEDSLGACRAGEEGVDCLDLVRQNLDSLLLNPGRTWEWERILDTTVARYLELGGEEAYHQLVGRVRTDSASRYVDGKLIGHILSYRLARAYEGFGRLPSETPPQSPDAAGIIPQAEIDALPEPFRAARTYRLELLHRVKAPEAPEHTLKDLEEPADWNYPGLYRHVLSYVKTGDTAALDSIRGYEWRGWCGTGSDALYGPKGDAFLLRDLESGNFAAAMRGTSDQSRIRQLLMAQGLDWEAYFLGGVVDGDPEIAMRSTAVLAEYGSEMSLRKLPALEEWMPDSHHPGLVEAMATSLLEPGERLNENERYRPWEVAFARGGRAPVLSDRLRTDFLEHLKDKVDRNPYGEDARLFVNLFSRLDFPERTAYLKRMAALPDPEVRKAALEALGPLAPDSASLPTMDPVEFIFTSGGIQFPDRSFRYGIPCPSGAESCNWGAGTSLRKGRHTMDRKSYLYAWREAKVLRVYNHYPGYDNPQDGVLYDVSIPIVENPKGPIKVDIPLHRVTLDLDLPPDFEAAQELKMTVQIEMVRGDASGYDSPSETRFRRKLVFGRLGDGVYRISLEVPGFKKWSRRLQVRGDQTVKVPLRPGRPGRAPVRPVSG